MNKIKINDKSFESKVEAIKYIESLNEILVVRIFAYPDLNRGRHGPILKSEYHFKSQYRLKVFDAFIVKEQIEPIIAELRNTLIKIYGAEYDYVMGSKSNPVKLWDVKADYEISDDQNVEILDMEKLVEDVKESFKDRLY